TIAADDIADFADAVGDVNPIFRDAAAAQGAGYANIPAQPTFVTRFRVSFAEAGLDPTRSQVLHGEQEYEYARPLVAGDTLAPRPRAASVRQSGRGGTAIMTLEQLGDTPQGERVVTGRSIVIVRETPPTTAGVASVGASAPAAKSRATPPTPEGERIPAL